MHDCRHDNVIPIYEFFEFYYEQEPDTFCMVMKLGSESLTFVKDNNLLTENQCLYIFTKVAAALKHIHSLGMVHRDLKPNNIIICFDGVPKLGDFGESARLRDDGTWYLIRTNETNTRKAIHARVSHMSAAYQELVLACDAFDPAKRPSSNDVFDTLENQLAQCSDARFLQNVVETFIQ